MAKNYSESAVNGFLMDEFGIPMDYTVEQSEQQPLENEPRDRERDPTFNAIKVRFGEKAAQIARGRGWLKIPNIVELLRYAGKNLKVLQDYLDDMLKKHNIETADTLDPIELLDRAGYKAWYVKNMKDQNKIAGYFRDTRAVKYGFTDGNPRSDKGEMICTVYTGLERGQKRFEEGWNVIHAVKKECWGDDKLPEDEWHIKPAHKGKESLDDEYSKSVISIQVSPSEMKIPQRYNHTIKGDADGGWHRNLEAIQPGLTRALEHTYKVKLRHKNVPLPSYYVHVGDREANKDHIINYNREINGVYIGDNFWCKDGNIKEFTKHQSLLIPNTDLVIDVKEREVKSVADADKDLAKSLTNIIKDLNEDYKLTLTSTETGGMRLVLKSSNKNKISKEDIEKGNFEKSKAIRTVIAEIEDGKIKYLNGMNADNIKITNDTLLHDNVKFDFGGVKELNIECALPSTTKIQLNPNANKIHILNSGKQIQLEDTDFSNIQDLNLMGVSLSGIAKFNPKADCIYLKSCEGLPQDLNFEAVNRLSLKDIDLQNKNIEFNKTGDLSLNATTGLKGDLDFCNIRNLNVEEVDWSKSDVNSIKLKHSADIRLKGFSGVLDLSSVPDGRTFEPFDTCDLSNLKQLKLNPKAKYIFQDAKINADNLKAFKGMSNVSFLGDLTIKDVTNSKQCDLSGLRRILQAHLTIIGKWNQKNYLSGKLDFSNESKLTLQNLDLRNAKVKFNEKGKVNLKWITGLHGKHNISHIGYFDNCNLRFAYINGQCQNDTKITNVEGLDGNFEIRNNISFAGTTFKKTAKLNIRSENIVLDLRDTKGLVGSFDLSRSNVIGADLSKVKFIGHRPHHLDGCKLGVVDLSKEGSVVNLSGADLTKAKLILPAHLDNLNLCRAVGLKGEYDFRDCTVDLTDVDFPDATIRIYGNIAQKQNSLYGISIWMSIGSFATTTGESTRLSGAKGTFICDGNKSFWFYGEFDSILDLSKANIIVDKGIKEIVMENAIGPKGTFDLKNVNKVCILDSDVSNTDIVFNPNASEIILNNVKGLKGTFDLKNVNKVYISYSDVSNTNIVFNPNASKIILSNLKGLKGDLDFSGVKYLKIGSHLDLSNVTSIKIAPYTILSCDKTVDTSKIHRIPISVQNIVKKGSEKVASFKKGVGMMMNKAKKMVSKQRQTDDRDI